jgi:hypothetical protein
MPRVPVYEEQVAQAPASAARVNLRVTPEDFGAGVAQGVEQLGAGLEKVAKAQKEKIDTARVMDATASQDSWDELAIYDPDQGALHTRKGKDAVGMTDEFMKARDEAVAAFRTGLSNDQQRLAFDRIQAEKHRVIYHTLSSHQAQESDGYAKQSTLSAVDSAVRSAASAAATGPVDAPATRSALDLARRQVTDAIDLSAKTNGLGDPSDPASPAGALRAAKVSELHQTVLHQLLARNDGTAAQTYLGSVMAGGKTVQEELGADGAKFVHDAEFVAKEQRSEKVAMDIAASSLDDKGRIDPTKALAKVDEFQGPAEDKKAIREKIDHRIGESDHAFRTRQDQLFSSAYTAGLNPQTGILTFDSIPTALRAQLARENPEKLAELKHRSDQDLERVRNLDGKETPEERQSWASMIVDMKDRPEHYANLSVDGFNGEWGAKLGPIGYRDGAQRLAITHKTPAEKVVSVQTPHDMLINEGRASGAWPKGGETTWSPEQRLRFTDAANALSEKINASGQDPKALKPDVITGWTREIVAKGTVPGRVWGTNTTTAVQAKREGRADFVPTISDADRRRVEAKYKARHGYVPNDDTIRAVLVEEQRLREGTP